MIYWHESCASTHRYVVDALQQGIMDPPFAVGADEQHDGIGSRGNVWIGMRGNLFLSWCVEEKQLPQDLPLASISIYFGMLAQMVLKEKGSKTWLKWPNDLYCGTRKIGGLISTKTGAMIVGSLGINMVHSPQEFGVLDISLTPKVFANALMNRLEEKIPWKDVFSKYKLEFEKSRQATFHWGTKVVSLQDAQLCDDGSIVLENKKVYSLR